MVRARRSHAGAEVVFRKGLVGVVLELVDGFRRRAGVGFDLGFELDCAIGKVVVGKGLIRGIRGGK